MGEFIETVPNLKELQKSFGKFAAGIDRPGLKELLEYLWYKTDFFIAPCSTVYHLNVKGGLILHSLNVYQIMSEIVVKYPICDLAASWQIAALFHDLCKANFYRITKRWNRELRKEVEAWEVKDQFPMGHGEKSVIILQNYIKLLDDEALAIRWHMSMFDPGIYFNYPSGYPYEASVKKSRLLNALILADYEATNFMEFKPNDGDKAV